MNNTRILGACLAIAAIACAAAMSRAEAVDDRTGREQWEYLVVAGGTTNTEATGNSSLRKEKTGSFARESFPLEKNLDKLGAAGWDLVAVAGPPAEPIYYFKRPK